MADETLLTHVADIVSAHVANNSLAFGDLPKLIEAVYSSLAGLGQAAAPIEEDLVPAVSIRSSVKPDAVTCLECGAKMKMLKRHLTTDHNLTPGDYRKRWNLPASYPMVAPDYAERRRALAIGFGLGRKPAKAAPTPAKPIKPARARKKLGVAFDGGAAGDAPEPTAS
jgi:predicted transcriptional regulator